jgi:nitrogen regulation protein NR(I)
MLPARKQILVVDDEANLRRVLAAQLGREGYEVHLAEDGEQGLAFLRDHHIDLVITDLRMPKIDGMELLRVALRENPQLPVVLLTAHGTVDNAVEALKTGAFDYLTKPFDKDEVLAIVHKALRTSDLASRDASLPHEPAGGKGPRFGLVGSSSRIQEVCAVIERVADTPTTVLITGESGTGKELVAHALHDSSSRAKRPFIKVNCAAIPKTLIESELFGYERGAFTGAVNSKPGRFELATGGTLFLDEVGEIPSEIQVKLLQVLQQCEFVRVGGLRNIRIDVRLVAATNRDLRRAIADGDFREDLFYRLNVVTITLPPLRDRLEDIPELVDHFIDKFNRRLKKQIRGLAPEAQERLGAHDWPGNIRELENVVERAVLFADHALVGIDDLLPQIGATEPFGLGAPYDRVAAEGSSAAEPQDGEGLKAQVKAATTRLERRLIERALGQTNGNVTHAARLLKISRKGLQLKMKELGLREREGSE